MIRLKKLHDGLLIALLLAAGLLALAGAGLAYLAAFQRALSQGERTLTGLLVAVEKTAVIGAYAEDAILLQEVVDGLALNPMAASVEVRDAKGKAWVVARARKPGSGAHDVSVSVERPLHSPFDASELTGTLRIEADMAALRTVARDEAWLLASAMLVQSLAVALLLYLIATRLVSRPIVRLADSLRTITPGSDARLPMPKLHQHDELGALVNSANDLLEAQEKTLTRERGLQTEIAQLGAEYKAIFSASSAGIFVMSSDMQLLHCNAKALALSAWEAGGSVDMTSQQFVEHTFAQPDLLYEMVNLSTRGGTTEAADLALKGSPDNIRWVHCLITVRGPDPSLTTDTPGVIEGVMYDITERKQTEQATHHRAEHDPLTGLLNRRGCARSLGQMLAESRGNAGSVSVLFMDLDGFKAINDTHGHAAGDDVLKEVARRVRAQVRRGSDLCARLGGDEFLVALRGTDECSPNLSNTAHDLLLSMDTPIDLANGVRVTVGTSVGIACAPRHGLTAEALIHQADLAMYEVKRTGKRSFAMAFKPIADDTQGGE